MGSAKLSDSATADYDSLAALRALSLSLALSVATCAAPNGPVVVVKTDRGNVEIRVEIARTRDEVSRGLMWRDSLDADAGMLFVFPRAAERTFWMKNTPLPLDIVFIDSAAEILSIAARTKPYSQAPIASRGEALYVLEVNAGFCKTHGIRPGMTVAIPAIESL